MSRREKAGCGQGRFVVGTAGKNTPLVICLSLSGQIGIPVSLPCFHVNSLPQRALPPPLFFTDANVCSANPSSRLDFGCLCVILRAPG